MDDYFFPSETSPKGNDWRPSKTEKHEEVRVVHFENFVKLIFVTFELKDRCKSDRNIAPPIKLVQKVRYCILSLIITLRTVLVGSSNQLLIKLEPISLLCSYMLLYHGGVSLLATLLERFPHRVIYLFLEAV